MNEHSSKKAQKSQKAPKAKELRKAQSEDAPDARGLRVGMVVSRFHAKITGALEAGARQVFLKGGGLEQDLIVLDAPGAFELPLLCALLARRPDVAAVVALGCVIRGETKHDRYLNDAVTRALAQLSVDSETPIGYGLLTVDTPRQAKERAGGKHGNKGADAMSAALRMARTIEGCAQ